MQILRAAAKLFADRGFAGVGVDEIGKEAGVTGPAIYRHFSGKDEILATLCDDALDQLVSLTNKDFEDAWDQLSHLVAGHGSFVVSHGSLAGVWIREGRLLSDASRLHVYRRQRAYIQRWSTTIARCLPHHAEDEHLTLTFAALGMLNSIATWPPAARRADPVGLLLRSVLDGLRGLSREPAQARTKPGA
ncbi:hypothetical protein DSM112329_04254 [Paraconexibacter sp. AEG42_29]|uniref:HTH tetR-type domain-containing protein n=1 Tax=Paraconexibacter sp. AEG42_29 TaxID=2997339 RepID=A0AAU7B097_9ACTN